LISKEFMKETERKPQQINLQEQSGGNKSPERRRLPSAWNVLERSIKLNAPDVKDRPREGTQEFLHEAGEIHRLWKELEKNGTPRDNLFLDLFVWVRAASPYSWPGYRTVSLEELQQLRSRVEPMSEEQITEEIDKLRDEWSRKYDPFYSFHKKG
jgi:hypothetical protein